MTEASKGLAASLVLLLAAIAGTILMPKPVLTGWLAAFCLASAASLGGLVFLMLAEIIPGPWRDDVLPAAGALSRLNVLLLPLCLPILGGMGWIYPWTGDHSLTGFKAVYLSPAFFGLRLLAILAAAAVLSRLLAPSGRRALAVGGLIALVLADTLLSTDLIQSLDAAFHSSGFGLYVLSLQLLTAFSMMVWIAPPVQGRKAGLSGALFLCLLLLWPYFFFMQYFVLWSGNLPHPAAWFQRRNEGFWPVCGALLAVLRLVPPAILLSGSARRSRLVLKTLAAASLLGSVVEFAWLILPELGRSALAGLLFFLLAAAGITLLFHTVMRHALPFLPEGRPSR